MIKVLRRRAGRKRVAASVALLAMILQVMVQAWHTPLVSAGTIKVAGDVPLIAICTVDGIEWIPFSALFGEETGEAGFEESPASSDEPQNAPSRPNQIFCAFCLSIAVTILTAVFIGLVLLATVRRCGVDRGAGTIVSPLSIHAPAPRGPPVPA